jgi:dynein heavy chain
MHLTNLDDLNLDSFKSYMAYIKTLAINDTPEIFGLHDNANITFAQSETFRVLQDLLLLQPKTLSGGGVSREEIMENSAKDILARVPKPIDIAMVMTKYPVMYEQSMNTVIVQEILR